jgi:hypothetical protein
MAKQASEEKQSAICVNSRRLGTDILISLCWDTGIITGLQFEDAAIVVAVVAVVAAVVVAIAVIAVSYNRRCG